MRYKIATFYKFVENPQYASLREKWLILCKTHGLKGTILLAPEGINGTLAGRPRDLDHVLQTFRSHSHYADLESQESEADELPFFRMKIKLKKEIVTLGIPSVKPFEQTGIPVNPNEWNQLLQDPDVITVDTRNDYEIAIGGFQGAISPHTTHFRDFPEFVEQHLKPHSDKKIAMYCTGGIRCEKSTAYLLEQGFKNVYQLKGGILKYLKEIPETESLWQGECFVFDNRTAVDHQLSVGVHDQCHGCRRPVSPEEQRSPHHEAGVQCVHCFQERTPEQLQRARERLRQMKFAVEQQRDHLG